MRFFVRIADAEFISREGERERNSGMHQEHYICIVKSTEWNKLHHKKKPTHRTNEWTMHKIEKEITNIF